MRRAAATLACLPLAALAGCGAKTIDARKAETFLYGAIQPAPRSVKCPSGVNAKAGRTFRCTVVAQDGRHFAVTLHIVDSNGRVRVGPSDVSPA